MSWTAEVLPSATYIQGEEVLSTTVDRIVELDSQTSSSMTVTLTDNLLTSTKIEKLF